VSDNDSERTFRNIDHVIALGRLVAELVTYSEDEVSELKDEYMAIIQEQVSYVTCPASLSDVALILLADLMDDFPVRREPEPMRVCQN
jgi:hypothetical protein